MDKQVKILGFDVNFCLFLVNYLIDTIKHQRLGRNVFRHGDYGFLWKPPSRYYLASLRTQMKIMNFEVPNFECYASDLKRAQDEKREMMNNLKEFRCFLLEIINSYQ